VTHPLLPNKAAPGQLSFAQIQHALHLLGQLPASRFFLFGTPISHSMSPTLHNTAFKILGLPHQYELFETETVGEEIKAALASPDFGGASVTIPHKLDVVPLLDTLSPEAEVIGAVNTIVPRRNADGSYILLGDNTDWIGIQNVVRAQLPSNLFTIEAALVIGAGGTARAAIYALHKLGAKTVYLFNRTRSAAQSLLEAFSSFVNVVLIEKPGVWPAGGAAPSVVVSTIPASATTVDLSATNAIYLSHEIFGRTDGGIVVDMAYRPAETPLLQLAAQVGPQWKTVRGVDVLLEQGFAQFLQWTGRPCPRSAVSEAVWRAYYG